MLKRLSFVVGLVLILVLTACGGDAGDSSSVDTSDADTEQFNITIGGTDYVLEGPSNWSNLTGNALSNLSVNVMPLGSFDSGDEPVEDFLLSFVNEAFEDLDVIEADNKTIYVSVEGEDVDIVVVFGEVDIIVFNVSTLGDAEFATYQDEIISILSSMREAE